jgi:hypothetical protein
MKVSWREVRFFGVGIALPVLVFLATQLAEHEIGSLKKHREEMANCERCKKLFKVRAGNAFILHLIDNHKFSDSEAMDEVGRLWKEWLEHKRRA